MSGLDSFNNFVSDIVDQGKMADDKNGMLNKDRSDYFSRLVSSCSYIKSMIHECYSIYVSPYDVLTKEFNKIKEITVTVLFKNYLPTDEDYDTVMHLIEDEFSFDGDLKDFHFNYVLKNISSSMASINIDGVLVLSSDDNEVIMVDDEVHNIIDKLSQLSCPVDFYLRRDWPINSNKVIVGIMNRVNFDRLQLKRDFERIKKEVQEESGPNDLNISLCLIVAGSILDNDCLYYTSV